jgi:hypothetical protein
MGKSLKYVKDFDFSSAGKAVGYCGGGMKKGYAEGGKADIAQDKAMIKTAVHKHEKSMHKGEPLTKLAKGGMKPAVSAMARKEIMATPTMEKRESVQRETVKAPAAPLGMIRDNSKLGIQGNKNPGIARRRMPVAPKEPMIKPYKAGGLMSDKGAKKVETVMGEYKSGELHSGSKTGPVVKNPKQAVAIALSEARNVGKKKK